VIKEYRKINKSWTLAENCLNKIIDKIVSDESLSPLIYSISIKNRNEDIKKWLNSNNFSIADNIPMIRSIGFKVFKDVHHPDKDDYTIDWYVEGYQYSDKLNQNDKSHIYLFAQALYHLVWPKFNITFNRGIKVHGHFGVDKCDLLLFIRNLADV
jgi:hypothetical protein